MRFVATLSACVAFLLCTASLAQETKKLQEPEFLGVFLLLDSSGNLVPLERQTPEYKVKAKAMGFGGGESVLEIKGERSPIRFTRPKVGIRGACVIAAD